MALHGLWLCQRRGAARAERNHINPKHVLLAALRLPFMDVQRSWSRLFAEGVWSPPQGQEAGYFGVRAHAKDGALNLGQNTGEGVRGRCHSV